MTSCLISLLVSFSSTRRGMYYVAHTGVNRVKWNTYYWMAVSISFLPFSNFPRMLESHCACMRACSGAQPCPTFCSLMNCNPPGSSVCGISQARIQEWVAISFSRGSSWPRDKPVSPALAGGFFTTEPPGKPQGHSGKDAEDHPPGMNKAHWGTWGLERVI